MTQPQKPTAVQKRADHREALTLSTSDLQPAFLPHRPAAHCQPTRCAKWPLKPPATPCNPYPKAFYHYVNLPLSVSPYP
jgi:hypothetical protein